MRARHVFLLGILISVTVSAAVPVSLIEAVKAGDAQAELPESVRRGTDGTGKA